SLSCVWRCARRAPPFFPCTTPFRSILGLPPVGEAGEAVDERLPFDDRVQPRVVERHDRVRGERDRSHACVRVERVSDEDERAERSEEHTSELQSRVDLVCRLLLEKK